MIGELVCNIVVFGVYRAMVQKSSGTRSEDELSIGAGASDDEYRDEFAQEADRAAEEIPKKTKSR